ncbi:MAG TPA: DUF1697 domain-containing protein [Pirellulales bacterium]|nr:DUF1697 domain-containing protein [Pirellulales bacterium]
MHTYIALLRAVNVGSTWIKMAELGELFSTHGFQDVATYIQSGNVVFSSRDSHARCIETIASFLEKRLTTPVCIILKNAKDMAMVVSENPFLEDSTIDPTKLHVTFLKEKPTKNVVRMMDAIKAGEDRFHVSGSVVYLHCPDGYGRTKLSNSAIERALRVQATTRNWKTVVTLLDMAQG